MPDREKIIRQWEGIIDQIKQGNMRRPIATTLVYDTFALLREQEPTTYAYDEYFNPTCQNCGFHPFTCYIPTLKGMEERGYNYCPKCGRKIKWEVSGDE